MAQITPFLWFNSNAGEAADFYLRVFPNAQRVSEVRSTSGGPQPPGSIVVITIQIEGQQITLLNGGPTHQLTPAFSLSVACDSQQEIDRYWDLLLDGGNSMACGWLTDRFGLSWQIVPRNIGKLIARPKAFQAMLGMIKLDIAALEAAAREN